MWKSCAKKEFVHNVSMSGKEGGGDKRFNNVDYTLLPETDDYADSQFMNPPAKIPWKPISLAVILITEGFILFIMASLIVCGYIDAKYSDQIWLLIFIGIVKFIPGIYHTRLAILAYKKVPGYFFEDMTEFD
ncbi:hypothetical protein HZH66_007033 [Vespula vulgaris]|uniref:Transmembrane protein 230 n=2 Tax=Vespula TaxID=7451 RepID=A0A834JXD4_VESVU|nr:transmembrane protein 230 isoform X1 [Vespula vulgaris]KAF7396171.1 hypothetical protein HZH66_007033 [Vespula vulgaris]